MACLIWAAACVAPAIPPQEQAARRLAKANIGDLHEAFRPMRGVSAIAGAAAARSVLLSSAAGVCVIFIRGPSKMENLAFQTLGGPLSSRN